MMMINSDKQLSPNQVIEISGFPQGARLPTSANVHQVFGNCGQIQSIHLCPNSTKPRIFVIFDTIGAARAALQLKHENWETQSLMKAPEDVVSDFNKAIARSEPDFGGNRPPSPGARPMDLGPDERFVGDSAWSARRRPGEAPMDYERSGPNQGSLPPQAYRGPPPFSDPMRDRGDPLDGPPRARPRSPMPSDFRRPLSPTGRGPPDSASYGPPPGAAPRRGPPIDYPPYGPGDRPMPPRDSRGPYPDERYPRRELSPPPQWTENRRRTYEDAGLELEASNKRMRLSDAGDPARPRPRDYPPSSDPSYRGGPPPSVDSPYRQPPPRGPPDAYPPGSPGPPSQYRSRTVDDQYPPPPAGRYGRDELPRFRSTDDYDGQYRRGAGGPPYSTSSLESGPGYRSSGAPPYSDYESSSRGAKPLPPPSGRSSLGGLPPPPNDYPPSSYRVDDRRGLPDYRSPEDYGRRYPEPGPPPPPPSSRGIPPRGAEDPRRGYMDGYPPPPPAIDDRRYEPRRYEGGRISDGMMDRDYDRRGPPPPPPPSSGYPPSGRAPSPPRASLASRLGMEPRGSSAMDPPPSGPRYRSGGGDYDVMMSDGGGPPPGHPSYRDDYRRMDVDPRDRERFDDRGGMSSSSGGGPPPPRSSSGFDLRDRMGYDPRDRDRLRDERDRDYQGDRYRRESGSTRIQPFDRNAGTRVNGSAEGTVIFVSNLPAQVSQPRFRRLFADAIGAENVMDVNTGRAGFAFVRIRTRELAEEAVTKLHHVEYAPRSKMNVSIGKPPHEYRKWKNAGFQNAKKAGEGGKPAGPGGADGNNKQKKKKKKKNAPGGRPPARNDDKEAEEGRVDGEGANSDDSGDESDTGSGSEHRRGGPGGNDNTQMTREEIEAFMDNVAKETGLEQSMENVEVGSEHSAPQRNGGDEASGGGGVTRSSETASTFSDAQRMDMPEGGRHQRYPQFGNNDRDGDGAQHGEQQLSYGPGPDEYETRTGGKSAKNGQKKFSPAGSGRSDPDDDAAVVAQLADMEGRSAPSEA